jgi:hypothetical protein
MFSSSLILIALLSIPHLTLCKAPQLVEAGSHDNSDECDCYLTSGPNQGYFQYYRFYDFRSIPDTSGNDFTSPPALVTTSDYQGNELITNSYFNTSVFNDNWSIQTGNLSDSDNAYAQVDSAQNVYITRNQSDPEQSTYLTLRTYRNPYFQSVAELDCNQKNLMHTSIRVRLRVIPNDLLEDPITDNPDINSSHPVAPGAVVGFFTFESNTEESDIEILTSDPTNRIHYSNQPDYDAKTGDTVPGASTDATLPSGKTWTEWANHRLDWYPGISQWWMDDQLLLTKTINVPKKPSGMILNLWSDGGEWSGNMTVGDQVEVGVEWIEMIFNVSGSVNGPSKRWTEGLWKRKEKHCKVACWVDGPQATEAGTPVVAWNNTASGAASTIMLEDSRSLAGMVAALAMFLITYTVLM